MQRALLGFLGIMGLSEHAGLDTALHAPETQDRGKSGKYATIQTTKEGRKLK